MDYDYENLGYDYEILEEQLAIQEEAQLAARSATMPSKTLIWDITVHDLAILAKKSGSVKSPALLVDGSRQFRLEIIFTADDTDTSKGEKAQAHPTSLLEQTIRLVKFVHEQGHGAYTLCYMERQNGLVVTASSCLHLTPTAFLKYQTAPLVKEEVDGVGPIY